jgi:uncharacterized RmlC-like cupin family protein
MVKLETPQLFSYKDYGLDISAGQLRHVLQRDMRNRLHWRHDHHGRIEDGARRTFLPAPSSKFDAILFGGSEEFKAATRLCIAAANLVMGDIVPNSSWEGNRVVMNHTPAGAKVRSQEDPRHFETGVVSIGAGPATVRYFGSDGEQTIRTGLESIMYIPAGVEHEVENGTQDRLSVVVVHDTQLAAGKTAVRQFVQSSFEHVVTSIGF